MTFCQSHEFKVSDSDFNRYNGWRIIDIVHDLVKSRQNNKHLLDSSIDHLINDYYHFLDSQYVDAVVLQPHVSFVLLKLQELGIRLAMVTSASEALVSKILRRFNLEAYFEVLITSEQFIKGKPDPEPYTTALSKLMVHASEAIAVEDSEHGEQSAIRAGFKCIRVDPDHAKQNLIDVLRCLGEAPARCISLEYSETLSCLVTEISPIRSKELDTFWVEQTTKRPSLYNAPLLTLEFISKKSLVTTWRSYSEYLASRAEVIPNPIIPVGVSGVLSYKSKLLIGRRSPEVTSYPEYLELVPSGGISGDGKNIDFEEQLRRELREETKFTDHDIQSLHPLCFIYDSNDPCFDIVMQINLDPSIQVEDILNRITSNEEYSTLSFIKLDTLASLLNDPKEKIVPTSIAIIQGIIDGKFKVI